MNVSLGHNLDTFVNNMVSSGSYQSQDEVIRTALHRLEQEKKVEQAHLKLKAKILVADKSVKKGKIFVADNKFFDDLLAKCHAKFYEKRI